jgi:hypothetical protein
MSPTAISFAMWKRDLFASAGSAKVPVERIGDYVLELFWKDGCEPTLSALLDYAQAGLPATQARNYPEERPSLPSRL